MGSGAPAPVHRVALFLPNLGAGGAERITVNLARGFVEAGHAVDMIAASASGAFIDALPSGVRLVDLRARRTAAALLPLARYLRAERPRALLSALDHANVVAILAARLARFGGSVWVAVHNDLLQGRRLTPRQRVALALLGQAYRRATGVIAVSHGVQRSVQQAAGVPAARIRMIYNPVVFPEILEQAQVRPCHPFLREPGPPVLLGIGRLVPQKNFALLLRSVAALPDGRLARVIILGEGEERAMLARLAEELGLRDRVDMPGFVPNPYAYLAHADLFVLSSDSEGLPTVLIEAMAVGTPVVSTDCPNGPREVLADGAHGELVAMGDVAGMAAAIVRALDAGRRPVDRAWLEQFTIAEATRRYADVLGLAAAGSGAAGSGAGTERQRGSYAR